MRAPSTSFGTRRNTRHTRGFILLYHFDCTFLQSFKSLLLSLRTHALHLRPDLRRSLAMFCIVRFFPCWSFALHGYGCGPRAPLVPFRISSSASSFRGTSWHPFDLRQTAVCHYPFRHTPHLIGGWSAVSPDSPRDPVFLLSSLHCRSSSLLLARMVFINTAYRVLGGTHTIQGCAGRSPG